MIQNISKEVILLFERDELLMIEELVEEEIANRKEKGEYDYYVGDKKVLESILLKVKEGLGL